MTVAWFILLAATTSLSFAGGMALANAGGVRPRVALALGVAMLVGWVWLMRHPALAAQLLPLSLLSSVEGAGVTPLFMFVIGIALKRARLPRQRRLAGWAAVLGVVYFAYGAGWMLQPMPAMGLSSRIEPGRIVQQSTDYSCVPAACATALNLIDVPTSEKEMARLTHARPRTGSTLVRAMHGMQQRLEGLPVAVRLTEADYDELTRLPMPAVTPLQYEAVRLHMVCLLEVTADDVDLADPLVGRFTMHRDDFKRLYAGHVVTLRRHTHAER